MTRLTIENVFPFCCHKDISRVLYESSISFKYETKWLNCATKCLFY